MEPIRPVSRRRRRTNAVESLESRVLMAADLVAQWRADDLNASLPDQATVTNWTDSVASIEAIAQGQPQLIKNAVSGRSVLRLETSDGIDSLWLRGPAAHWLVPMISPSPSRSSPTQPASTGAQAAWYRNSGLVDANQRGYTQDWGLTINATGQLAGGLGAGMESPSKTVYSSATGLNDGQLHVAVLTRSQSQLTLYVDGTAVGSTSEADAASRAATDMWFGRSAYQGPGFDGDLAQIRLYRSQLTAEEVAGISSELRSYYINSAPQAVPDQYTFGEDPTAQETIVSADRGVLANDTDADHDPLTAELVTGVSHGTLTLNADGSFVYDPDPDYFGSDAFTYVARDFRASDPVTVTLQVTPRYDPAIAQADQYRSRAGIPLVVTAQQGLLANDSNPDRVNLQAVLVQDVTHGQLSLAADGSFTYDPQQFTGVETFTYRASDGTNLSNTVSVTLVINTAPLAYDDRYVADEDIPLHGCPGQTG